MDIKLKYFKYKQKYLKLYNQLGGVGYKILTICDDNFTDNYIYDDYLSKDEPADISNIYQKKLSNITDKYIADNQQKFKYIFVNCSDLDEALIMRMHTMLKLGGILYIETNNSIEGLHAELEQQGLTYIGLNERDKELLLNTFFSSYGDNLHIF